MGGDDLDELVLLASDPEQELRRREVLRLPVAERERVVGDSLDDVLEKRVLASLGRARIGLHGEDLLPERRREKRLELGLGRRR